MEPIELTPVRLARLSGVSAISENWCGKMYLATISLKGALRSPLGRTVLSLLACWKIKSEGLLYVGWRLVASTLQFESTILSNLPCSWSLAKV
jgi:hypothetical protein